MTSTTFIVGNCGGRGMAEVADSRAEVRPLEGTPAMVVVAPGTFLMGAGDDDKFATDTERPRHAVTISWPFAVGRHPVTVAEYRAFAPRHAPGDHERLPVVNVSWGDAQAYCDWLARRTGVPFRLLSEAEWEFACRAGTTTPFNSGSDVTTCEANFLYSETGDRIGVGRRAAIGARQPNALGLHDMHGNVCEWVADAWHPIYEGAPTDGSAWRATAAPARRVIRGGAWDHLPRLLRSSWRDGVPEQARRDNIGFRVGHTLEN